MKQGTVTPKKAWIILIDSSVQSDLSICTFCSKKSVLPNSPEVHSITGTLKLSKFLRWNSYLDSSFFRGELWNFTGVWSQARFYLQIFSQIECHLFLFLPPEESLEWVDNLTLDIFLTGGFKFQIFIFTRILGEMIPNLTCAYFSKMSWVGSTSN